MSQPRPDFVNLSVAEHNQLAEDIWDSIVAEIPEAATLSPAQLQELHACLEAHEQDPSSAFAGFRFPWFIGSAVMSSSLLPCSIIGVIHRNWLVALGASIRSRWTASSSFNSIVRPQEHGCFYFSQALERRRRPPLASDPWLHALAICRRSLTDAAFLHHATPRRFSFPSAGADYCTRLQSLVAHQRRGLCSRPTLNGPLQLCTAL